MAYRTILVVLNSVNRADTLIRLSVDLARKNQAHLIGLFVIPAVNIIPMTAPMELPPEVIETRQKHFEEKAQKVKTIFEDAVRAVNFSADWRCVNSMSTRIGDSVITHAHMADLVIVSQDDPESPYTGQSDLAEQLVMETGRPVLTIPIEGNFEQVGDYVLVAWNATKQAARAAFDALPVLKNAKMVTLAWVDPPNAKSKDVDIVGSEMATTLARHDVKIEATHVFSNGQSGGEALLDQVRNHGADLLVMGGYGHSRFREYVFGGVTHHILEKMTVPVLMSH